MRKKATTFLNCHKLYTVKFVIEMEMGDSISLRLIKYLKLLILKIISSFFNVFCILIKVKD